MFSRVMGWIGGGLLTGALALTTSGAAAPGAQAPAAAPAPPSQACACAPQHSECVSVDLQDLPEVVDAQELAAHKMALASGEMSRALQEGQQALAEVQEAPDERSIEVFSFGGRAWLGIRMEDVSAEKAKELKLPADRGALVAYVAPDSPAAKAGIKVGDVITEFDGQRVEGTVALQRLVHEVPAGRTVGLAVWRAGRAQSLSVEISSRGAATSGDHDYIYAGPDNPGMTLRIPRIQAIPAIPSIDIGPLGPFPMFGAPLLGIDAEDLSDQLGNYFGAPDGQGVLVREVMPGTPAEKAGLKAGDVILSVDGNRVKDAAELRSALRDKISKAAEGADSQKAAPVTADLTVLRSGKELTVRVELQIPARRIRPARHLAV
jgi:serine protease Do